MAGIEIVVIVVVALGASLLTFFSGFGLGTLLLPAFALVFPLEVAVAATAVVHLANNGWKCILIGRFVSWATVVRFGGPAALAAFAGAGVLLLLRARPVVSYEFGGVREVTVLGLVVGGLITLFALFDLVPRFKRWRLDRRYLVVGGAVSGFFGGLSGHQGALRSQFLSRAGLHPAAFIATGTFCAMLVDVSRISVYATGYAADANVIGASGGWLLVGLAILSAFLGALIGRQFLEKVTIDGIRTIIGTLLMLLGPAIMMGLV